MSMALIPVHLSFLTVYIIYYITLVCAEYLTNKVKKEIEFYDKYKPYDLIKTGTFGYGIGIEGEYLIPIKIDIKKDNTHFQDEFEWDILNLTSRYIYIYYYSPELFAKSLVLENNLDPIYVNLISMDIRKQIKKNVYNLFIDFSANFNEDNKLLKISKSKKSKKKSKKSCFELSSSTMQITKNFSNISLKNILGKKRKRSENEKYDNNSLPSFLQNTEDSLQIYYSYYNYNYNNNNINIPKTSEYLVDSNKDNIIIKKSIFLVDQKDFLSKESYSTEHYDLLKTEDDEKAVKSNLIIRNDIQIDL